MHPGVSFVITVYNKAAEIAATAASLFAQTGDFPREFIFVDDGSTDRSLDLLRQAAAGRDDVTILSIPNGGPSRAFNYGARRARYPVIKPMDGDDILHPDATRHLLRVMTITGAAVVFGRKVVVDSEAAALADAPPYILLSPRQALDRVIDSSLSGCSEVLVHKAAFDRAGGCDERVFIQDQSYIRRLVADGAAVAMVDQVVAFSPPSGADALCFNAPQIDHDNNAAWAYLYADRRITDRQDCRWVLRKCASRAWKYARRVQKRPLGGDAAFWVYMLSYLPVPIGCGLFRATLTPFRRTGRVRD